MLSKLYGYIGIFAAFIVTLFGSFFLGKRDGVKTEQMDNLEDGVELREKYEEIDNAADVADPLSKLR
jgi:hypothetical protein